MLLVMSILVIYLVLGILYESFIHPDHHSLRTALGRPGRAGDAVNCSTRT